MKKVARSGLNYFVILILIALGVFGLALPIIPGLIFIVVAVVILSYEIPFIERKLEQHIDKDKDFGKMFYKYKAKLDKYFR
jgi:uncharacterized membrane protein YbaN (DUF454 family)